MKTINLNKTFAAALAAIILASLVFGSLLTRMYFPQIGQIKGAGPEDPLEAWSESSVIIWQYNTTFYASRNMSTLMVMELRSNASAVINNAFGNMTAVPPQQLVVLKGNFTLDSPLIVGSYTYVDAVQAVLIMGGAITANTVQFSSGATMSEWHGGLFIGNGL